MDLPKPVVGFPWDSLLAVALGLIVFFWGVASGFLTEEVEAVNRRGSGVITDTDEQDLDVAVSPPASGATSPAR
jgi:hypothetical protein